MLLTLSSLSDMTHVTCAYTLRPLIEHVRYCVNTERFVGPRLLNDNIVIPCFVLLFYCNTKNITGLRMIVSQSVISLMRNRAGIDRTILSRLSTSMHHCQKNKNKLRKDY